MITYPSKPSPETKTIGASTSNVAEVFDDFMEAFDTFKQTNDERLCNVEKQIGCDPLTEEKMNQINRSLERQKSSIDSLLLKRQRPSIHHHTAITPAKLEHKQAFEHYVRCGKETGLRSLEEKSMSSSLDSDGGYLVPEEIANDIGKRLSASSPIRSIASVRTVSSSMYKKPFAISGPAVGWVSEKAIRGETNSPRLDELQFPTMELYAMPAATASLLEDSAIDLDSWIAEEIEAAFSEQESTAFVSGNGSDRPKGFLTASKISEKSWSWGKLGYIKTGARGNFSTSNASDVLIDTIYALKAGYRQNAHWVMNRKSQASVRKLKDADGNYLWQAPSSANVHARLMGFPVVESEDMPDIAPDSYSIAFGDFRRGYLIIDRAGVRVLRDPYSSKPYVLFYTTKRVGGGIQDFDAIKLIKFGTA